jgi:hypothetical protein
MSRIPDSILECSIYLYRTVDEARTGIKAGGSGFLVAVPSVVHNFLYIYAVTNYHIILGENATVIRLNTVDNELAIHETHVGEWKEHPKGDDIAVCFVSTLYNPKNKYKTVPISLFITQEIIDKHNIGVGDDAFLVGRFHRHDGTQRNLPSIRFGNIAMMPNERIVLPSGFPQESFLVEMRSIGGYSGSPVFIQIPPFSIRHNNSPLNSASFGPWLLGVDWGHLDIYEVVRNKSGIPLSDIVRSNPDRPDSDVWRVKSNSGMTGVVPAWKLQELLYLPELISIRHAYDKAISDDLAAKLNSDK